MEKFDQKNQYHTIAVACYNKNLSQREASSSGGIFILIAAEIINAGGIVYGAAFDKNFHVVHKRAETIAEVRDFQTSKYASSLMAGCFAQCKRDLEKGKKVLFTGTPCQTASLCKYLKKEYENLLLADVICHGTPSGEIWNKYLAEVSSGKNIRAVNFRDKRKGWKDFYLTIQYQDGSEYAASHSEDLYMRGFLSDITLRESCYHCHFKGLNKKADITLGDLWGAKEIVPQLDDNQGISLILINSERGQNILESVSGNLVKQTIPMEDALRYNPMVLKSAEPNIYRPLFITACKKHEDLIPLFNRLFHPSRLQRVSNKIFRIKSVLAAKTKQFRHFPRSSRA